MVLAQLHRLETPHLPVDRFRLYLLSARVMQYTAVMVAAITLPS